MDAVDLHPADDHSIRYFIWHEWLQANGPLTERNVFEYFMFSMFFDKQSTNNLLRMQTMFTGVPVENEAEELKRFVGIEFAVTHAEPPSFFIIQKRNRLSATEVQPIASYFISNNRIYEAPSLYSLVSIRLLASVTALQTSLDILRKHRPDYTPRTGFVWPIVGDNVDTAGPQKKIPAAEEAADEGAKAPEAEGEAAPSGNNAAPSAAAGPSGSGTTGQGLPGTSKKRVNTMLLLNAMRTTAMNSKISAPSSAALLAESVTAETPSTAQVRSSATPAPSAQEAAIKGIQGETSKAAGKKKRKRSVVIQQSQS